MCDTTSGGDKWGGQWGRGRRLSGGKLNGRCVCP
jgi:hypothetical protein